jgi:hypothetical protein
MKGQIEIVVEIELMKMHCEILYEDWSYMEICMHDIEA